MTDQEQRLRMSAYFKAWEEAGAYLEEERRVRVRKTDTARDLPAFDGLVLAALKRFPPEPTSGLVEQQRLFRKLHPQRK